MSACLVRDSRAEVLARVRWRALALGGLMALGQAAAQAAQAEPLALLARAEQAPVQNFLERSGGPLRGSTDVIELLRADLDADGREELVMLWGLFGATSTWPSLTVFRAGPRGWQEAGTQDLAGQAGWLAVQDREIRVELRKPAPEDPRCCPSQSSTGRYRWDGQRLVELR